MTNISCANTAAVRITGSRKTSHELRANRRSGMAVVAGADFGTLSVRVSIVDSDRGLLASAAAEYPLHRRREDPEFATQSHADHMNALAAATKSAVQKASIDGTAIGAI